MVLMSKLNRRGGPMGNSLVIILGLIFGLLGMAVASNVIMSTWLDNQADMDMRAEMNGLVHEIKLVCQGAGPRTASPTIKPKYGFVFIRDLSDIERDRIVEETNCQQYCLCVVRAESAFGKPKSGYFSKAEFTGANSEILREKMADKDFTKIIGCVDIRAATTLNGNACFKDIPLILTCLKEPCEWNKDDWGIPVYRNPVNEKIYSMNTLEQCPSNYNLRIYKSGDELDIAAGAIIGDIRYPECDNGQA